MMKLVSPGAAEGGVGESFDYLIVGAGSAGCVLARRLAEAGTVCVLEAGPPDRNPFIHIPAGFLKTAAAPGVNWLYSAEPGPWTGGRRIAQPRGRTLGGSGSINGHIVNRGQAADFDLWARRGNRGWSYAELLPYFKRLECRIGAGDDTYRGRGGPLKVTDCDWPNPLVDAFIEGAASLGIPRNPDYNGASQSGVAIAQGAIWKGRRISPAVAWLRPALATGRVKAVTGALVDRLLFDGRRAVGAVWLRGGARRRTFARREVILAAGAFNSPQLLHRSGVGPARHLAAIGVGVAHPLAGVGENLRDHCYAPVIARTRDAPTLNRRTRGLALLAEIARYAVAGKGVLTLPPSLVYLSWRSRPSVADDDVQITFAPGSYDPQGKARLDRLPAMTAGVWQHRPESSGHVRARSPDPRVPPEIQPNYLVAENDRRVLLAGLRLARAILRQPPLAPYYDFELHPGIDCQSDDQWLAAVGARCGTTYHPMGSCRMGPQSDPMAVVSDQLKVHGLERLRVVDASIMPTMPSANLNAATLAIAEKAADMILGKPPLPPEDPAAEARRGPTARSTDLPPGVRRRAG